MRQAMVLILLLLAPSTQARVERYAIVIGNNVGDKDEETLRFAEQDAAKLYKVLLDLGGFDPENALLLQGRDAEVVRRALIRINDRIRVLAKNENTQSIVLVYYSGHADEQSLHLGDTSLDFDQLKSLVRGSAAHFRLLIIDACRSGALTRSKGLKRIESPFSIQMDERLATEGVVFLTASAADEDAQESDELKGSFFTHFLVSGLMGAADTNGDGRIGLSEAYRYAFEHTIRATSRTLAGTQHPSFQYDLHGRGDAVLTMVPDQHPRRVMVTFPAGRRYLLLRENKNGPVVAEVGAHDRRRRISVKPGRYFVRGRGRDHIMEGALAFGAGQIISVDDDLLDRVEYARLVRKGRGALTWVHGPQAGFWMKSPMFNSDNWSYGAVAGYGFEFESFNLTPRLGVCQSGFENARLSADLTEFDMELRFSISWDLPVVTIQPGISAGAVLFQQRFSTRGEASPRTSLGGQVGAFLGVVVDLPSGFFLGLDTTAHTYFFMMQDEGDEESGSFGADFALSLSFLAGKRL